ncbi:MAG: M50 family metallopeptidase [Elusimicrobiota bacterium]|jgi:regulator of sigma E protease|nr:M50 family metallopeptidase [Elusimicrobiota bacterium]
MTLIIQILGIAFGLGFLIFIHELGHFTAAKMCKVRVLIFAFGFGMDLFKFVRNGTKYCIKIIPFGGFVEMLGDDPSKAATGAEGEHSALPWYKKAFIAFAGPLANYILAVIIFSFVFNFWGASQTSTMSQIGLVAQNYPAYSAGLLEDDIITNIDGAPVVLWTDISENLKNKSGQSAAFVIQRGSYSFNLSMVVAQNPVTTFGIIGISPKIIKKDVGFFESFQYGAKAVVIQTVMTISYLLDKIISWEKPDISGPIGIMQVMANATQRGAEDYLSLLGIISVALGLFNLFPIPFVDGGMIILYLIEGIIRRRIGAKIIFAYNTIGIIIISGIFIFATYSDLIRLGVGKLFKG